MTTGNVGLTCNKDDWTRLFDYEVPAGVSGYAFARVEVNARNSSSSAPGYGWLAKVAVGPEPQVAYEMGDDLCPLATKSGRSSGYGFVKPGDRIGVAALQTRNPCTDNQVIVDSATLLVWIEDPQAQCQRQDIRVASFFSNRAQKDVNTYQHWTTTLQPIVGQTMTTVNAAQKFLVHADVVGTRLNNPTQACGSEYATLVSSVRTADGAGGSRVLDSQSGKLPASQGLGHLLLSSPLWLVAEPGMAGAWPVFLDVGANYLGPNCDTAVDRCLTLTGGNWGDAILGLIRFE